MHLDKKQGLPVASKNKEGIVENNEASNEEGTKQNKKEPADTVPQHNTIEPPDPSTSLVPKSRI